MSRLLIEVVELPAMSVDASYLLTHSARDFSGFLNAERKELHELDDYNELSRAAFKLFKQFRKGLIGPGDESHVDTAGRLRYVFSILEDAGKRTGAPWQNAYPFGPLPKLTAMTLENEGWPNRVMESRPVPYGVGHSPDGTEY
jgi:hypothetical protein